LRCLISYKIQFELIAIARVRFISLRITGITRGRSTLMWGYNKICKWIMDDKVIDLVKISTKKNLVDMMTKTIPVKKFRASLNFIKIHQR